MSDKLKFKTTSFGGNVPVQGHGTIGPFRWYFRARGESWSFEVGTSMSEYTPDGIVFQACGDWLNRPFSAGWMHQGGAELLAMMAADLFIAAEEEKATHEAAYLKKKT